MSVTESILWNEGSFPTLDGVALWRRSVYPAGKPVARLGLLTGYGDHGLRYTHFLTWMATRGIACHALDFRGQGRAGGRRGYINDWEEYLEDAVTFLDQSEVQKDSDTPLFLLGQSHGALVLSHLAMNGSIPSVKGAIFTSPFFRNRVPTPPGKLLVAKFANQVLPQLRVATDVPRGWMTRDPAMLDEDDTDALAQNTATPRWFVTMQVAQKEALRRAPEFNLPLLMITGDEDQVSDNDAAAVFFAKASSTSKTHFRACPCRHEPLRELNREKFFEQIYQWIGEQAQP